MVKRFLSRMVTCALVAFASFNAGAAEKIRLLFVFDKGAMDYISQAGADYDEFAASCVTRMNTVLTNSRLNDYFTYELAGTTLLPGVDNTNPATGYTEGWAALTGNRGEEWADMLTDRYNNAADVVVLLINTGSYAGATGNSHPFTSSGAEYAINYAGSAFSVCSIMTAAREIQGIASGHQVLSHEVAHTLGCGHPDTQDRQPGPQSTSYASGMQFRLPDGKETALPPSASVTQDVTAYYGTTLMGYSERFFKHADGTYMTLAEVLDETGWTDAGEGVMYWDNTDGVYGSSYPNGVWTYCYIVPYFSSPNLYFSNVTVPYGMELTDGVVTVYDQAQYDAMSAEDKTKVVPMGDATHNNRQVLIDNYQYASRWHLGVKFSKSGTDNVVNGASDKISLTGLSKNLTIYYTTDGTEPTKSNGKLYTEPFSLTTAATVKARSYDANDNAGDVLSKSYTMLPLATALGNTELTWTVGDYPWCVEEGVARSRVFASSEAGNQSVLATTIVGPATVNFDYRVWSAGFAMEDYSDKFIVMLDGVEYLSLTDTNVDEWTAIDSIEVPEGGHTLSLVFRLQEYWGDSRAAVRNVSVEKQVEPEPAYEGPKPIAVWVAGEFGDDKSAHGGIEISLNGNTTNALGQIVIGNNVTTGATIKLPDSVFAKASILVKYELASGGAPVVNAAPIGVVSTDGYPIVPICTTESGNILTGAYLNKNNSYALDTNTGNYWPFSSTPTISNGEGYILLSYHSELANPMSHGTAVYVGSSVNTLVGGNANGLQWKSQKIDKMSIGGPTAAGGAKPWRGMVIKGVALFTDEWLTPDDIANFKFSDPGMSDEPEDPVAMIGETPYDTLQSAIDAASDDAANPSTITLLKDIGDAVTLSSKTIILNENGCSFSGALSGSGTLVLAGMRNTAMEFGEWDGTVVLPEIASIDGSTFSFNNYGKEGSKVRITGNIGGGWLPNIAVNPTIDIPEGSTLAISAFSASFANTFKALSGSGTLSLTYSTELNTTAGNWYPNYSAYFLVNDVSGFTGSLTTATPGIAIGTNKPQYRTAGGKILLTSADVTLTVHSASPTPETTVANSRVKATGTNPVVYSVVEFIPVLPEETSAAVAVAIEDASFADAAVAAVINGSDDSVEEYKAFKEWANTIEGGEAAVVNNQYAAAAYVLGATTLFENKPGIEISEADVDTTAGAMTLTVTVMDGETPKEVASSKVKELFEATSDLSDWIGKMLVPTVIDLTEGQSHTLRFTVRPGDGKSPSAFLRIRK